MTTTTATLTAADAVAELARRAHNRAAKKDATLARIEAASQVAFAASKADLEAVIAAAADDDNWTPEEYRCAPDTCGDCDNYAEGCDAAAAAYAAAA